jgi:hypothetical protein
MWWKESILSAKNLKNYLPQPPPYKGGELIWYEIINYYSRLQ